MLEIVNKKRKYLFLIPAFLLIGFLSFFAYTNKDAEIWTLNEEISDMTRGVNLLAATTSRYVAINDESDKFDVSNIEYFRQMFNLIRGEYSALYDENLVLLYGQFKHEDTEYARFDPLQYDEFLKAVKDNDSGTMSLIYTQGKNERPIQIYFKWAPTSDANGHKFLICGGVFESVFRDSPLNTLAIGTIVLVGITFFINMVLIALLVQLGSADGREVK